MKRFLTTALVFMAVLTSVQSCLDPGYMDIEFDPLNFKCDYAEITENGTVEGYPDIHCYQLLVKQGIVNDFRILVGFGGIAYFEIRCPEITGGELPEGEFKLYEGGDPSMTFVAGGCEFDDVYKGSYMGTRSPYTELVGTIYHPISGGTLKVWKDGGKPIFSSVVFADGMNYTFSYQGDVNRRVIEEDED